MQNQQTPIAHEFAASDQQRFPFLPKPNKITTQVIFQNYGPGEIFRPYGLLGMSNHTIQPTGSWGIPTQETPQEVSHQHTAMMEGFTCMSGEVNIGTVLDGKTRTFCLSPGDTLFLEAGVEHWGESDILSVLQTIASVHRDYQGGAPWSRGPHFLLIPRS